MLEQNSTERRAQVRPPSSIYEKYDPWTEPQLNLKWTWVYSAIFFERPPQDTNTAIPYRTGLYTFSHLFVLNVFNVDHPAEFKIVSKLRQSYVGPPPLTGYPLAIIKFMVLIKDNNFVYLSGGRIWYGRTCGVLHHEGSLEDCDNPVDGPGPVVGQLALHPRLVGHGRRQARREGPNLKAETRDHHAETTYTDKKETNFFLIYKEIQNGTVAKSYMTNGLLIYGAIFAHFLICTA